jgi:hypothetical protein
MMTLRWRLHMKPINAAGVLRFVHREAGFLKYFEHVGVPGFSVHGL